MHKKINTHVYTYNTEFPIGHSSSRSPQFGTEMTGFHGVEFSADESNDAFESDASCCASNAGPDR